MTQTRPALRLLLIGLLSLQLSSCASLNCTSLESLLGGQADLVQLSYEIADGLISSAMPPLIPNAPEMPVLLTTFTNNNSLEHTSRLGLLLQEQIGSRLVQQGYAVREIRMQQSLDIAPRAGETMLSRELEKLAKTQEAQAVVVGTYSRTDRRLYISARLVNPVDRTILASNDYRICLDKEMLELLDLRLNKGDSTAVPEPSQPFLNRFF